MAYCSTMTMDHTITPPAEEYLISIDYPTREETSEVIAAIKTIKATALDCVITAEARRDQMLDAIRDVLCFEVYASLYSTTSVNYQCYHSVAQER